MSAPPTFENHLHRQALQLSASEDWNIIQKLTWLAYLYHALTGTNYEASVSLINKLYLPINLEDLSIVEISLLGMAIAGDMHTDIEPVIRKLSSTFTSTLSCDELSAFVQKLNFMLSVLNPDQIGRSAIPWRESSASYLSRRYIIAWLEEIYYLLPATVRSQMPKKSLFFLSGVES